MTIENGLLLRCGARLRSRNGSLALALLPTVLLGALLAAAPAAGATPDWGGAYIGLFGGAGNAKAQNVEVLTARPLGSPPSRDYVGEIDSNRLRPEGGLGGAVFGYNVQRGRAVFGVEGDFALSGVSDSTSCSPPFPFLCNRGQDGLMEFRADFDVNWIATVRLRAGATAGSALLFVTGGAAFADVEQVIGLDFEVLPFRDPLTGTIRNSDTLTGYAIGAGAELGLARGWTARLEYQVLDFGEERIEGRGFGRHDGEHLADFTSRLETTIQVVRAGLAYRF